MIYFFQRGKGGPIKIGYTKHVLNRLRSIQANCPEKLINLGHIEGDLESERLMHNFFQEYKLNGEWYSPDIFVMNYIMTLITGIDLNSIESDSAETHGIDYLLENIEKKILCDSLKKYLWNIKETAHALRIGYRSIRYRIEKYNLQEENCQSHINQN